MALVPSQPEKFALPPSDWHANYGTYSERRYAGNEWSHCHITYCEHRSTGQTLQDVFQNLR